MWKIINEGNWYERAYQLSGILAHGNTYSIINYNADSALLIQADTVGPVAGVGGSSFTFLVMNGNEAFAIAKINAPGDTTIIDVIGEESGTTVPDNWDVAGVVGAGAEHTWVRKPSVCSPNPVWSSSAGTDSANSEWILYGADYWDDVNRHSMLCAAPTPTVSITFQVDMSQSTVAPEGVHLAGSFQGWVPDGTPMSDTNADGIWEVTLDLDENQTYEFKYINGNAWGADESVPGACAQNNNRFVVVGTVADTLDVVCFASCGPCSGLFDVTFRVDMSEQTVSADGVHIAGNFQGWDPGATAMDDSDSDGIYEYTIQLGGNTTYQYKFINGNAWGFDEAVPAECAADNNRFLDVTNASVTTEPFCFGSCNACDANAIDELLDASLNLYPNPNNGSFQVDFDLAGSQEMTVRVVSLIGQVVDSRSGTFHAGLNSVEFNLDNKGLYIVELRSEKGTTFRRVMVN
ncbi:MAG: T9SS type A sorting domain-containing protein [Bacteroidia bacterium]